MQKLLDISKLSSLGWKAKTSLEAGAAIAYADFLAKQQ
jgi:nucleoside-diphosphate-sugar epimerase